MEPTLPDTPDLVVTLVTAPTMDVARTIARALVDARLVACATLIDGVRSLYRWQGAVEEASEVQLVLKTRRAHVPRIALALKELHPYQVPELVALPIVGGLAPYLDWVRDGTGA